MPLGSGFGQARPIPSSYYNNQIYGGVYSNQISQYGATNQSRNQIINYNPYAPQTNVYGAQNISSKGNNPGLVSNQYLSNNPQYYSSGSQISYYPQNTGTYGRGQQTNIGPSFRQGGVQYPSGLNKY